MTPDWPEKIAAAQLITHYKIGGQLLPRVKYGDEEDDWGADRVPCHDCGSSKASIMSDQHVMWSAARVAGAK